jgi:hypothetical protein
MISSWDLVLALLKEGQSLCREGMVMKLRRDMVDLLVVLVLGQEGSTVQVLQEADDEADEDEESLDPQGSHTFEDEEHHKEAKQRPDVVFVHDR